MRSGPKALIYRGAMFRISELAWVKVAPLSPLRWGVRIALGVLGLAFAWAVSSAKGSWWNFEWLLGLLAVHVAWQMHGDIRLASTGDLEDSYEDRGGSGDKATFLNWVGALNAADNEVKVGNPNGSYFHWLNLSRIAWARSCTMVEAYGLVLAPVFLGYNWLIGQGFKLPSHPVLDDLHILTFEGGTGLLGMLCWLLALTGLGACLSSIRRAVEVRASGGLTDRLPMSAEDQKVLFDALAGNRVEGGGKRVDKKLPERPAVAETPAPAVAETPAPSPTA